METYLVGGAVRDKLLGIPVKDRDWVVVGSTPEAMLQAGYKAVGKDFPVFLHPETHEEYALARTERKTGPGYHGFHFNTDVTVTLEDDLLRRDLTLNAIAEDANGHLIDPFAGQQDIADKLLRHVSPAFAEDPVRVLRIAKFIARFAHLGFTVAEPTKQLVRSMVNSGEVDNLVAERVWQELKAALASTTPRAFFDTLIDTTALPRIMPEIDHLLATSPALDALDAAVSLSEHPRIRFAALCASFTSANASELAQFCQRLRVPKSVSELAMLTARYAQLAHEAQSLNTEKLHALLKSLDVTRRPERFEEFLLASQAHAIATKTATNDDQPVAQYLQQCAQAMASIDAAHIAKSTADKSAIANAIELAERSAIRTVLSS